MAEKEKERGSRGEGGARKARVVTSPPPDPLAAAQATALSDAVLRQEMLEAFSTQASALAAQSRMQRLERDTAALERASTVVRPLPPHLARRSRLSLSGMGGLGAGGVGAEDGGLRRGAGGGGIEVAGNKRKQVFFRVKRLDGDDAWRERLKQLLMARRMREKREQREERRRRWRKERGIEDAADDDSDATAASEAEQQLTNGQQEQGGGDEQQQHKVKVENADMELELDTAAAQPESVKEEDTAMLSASSALTDKRGRHCRLSSLRRLLHRRSQPVSGCRLCCGCGVASFAVSSSYCRLCAGEGRGGAAWLRGQAVRSGRAAGLVPAREASAVRGSEGGAERGEEAAAERGGGEEAAGGAAGQAAHDAARTERQQGGGADGAG